MFISKTLAAFNLRAIALKETNLPLKADKLEKHNKFFKKLRKFKRNSENMAGKKLQNHFWSLEFCHVTCSNI